MTFETQNPKKYNNNNYITGEIVESESGVSTLMTEKPHFVADHGVSFDFRVSFSYWAKFLRFFSSKRG